MSARIPLNASFHYRLLSSLTRINHAAPLMILNHHTASQESQLWSVVLHRHLTSHCAHVASLNQLGFLQAGGKPKPFLSTSSVNGLVVSETSYIFSEGDKLWFTEMVLSPSTTFYSCCSAPSWRISLTTNDDVSSEGSGEASITSMCGEFYWLSPFVIIRHRCWAEDNRMRSRSGSGGSYGDLMPWRTSQFLFPGRLIHQLPEKCSGVGNSCSFRQWLLYPLMFKPSVGEKLMGPQQWAVTGWLSSIRYNNRNIEPLAVFLQAWSTAFSGAETSEPAFAPVQPLLWNAEMWTAMTRKGLVL